MTVLSATQTKNLKRPHELSITLVDTRPVKKNCRLAVGSLSIPKNNGQAYREELSKRLFYTFCPLDNTNIQQAIRQKYLDRVVYGMCGNTVVEKLVLDEETRIPWQVPKVTVEYKRMQYVRKEQEYTSTASKDEGQPVSPMTRPRVEEMSRAEYEAAVEAGDTTVVAAEGKHLFEFCRDAEIGWLKYEDR